MEFKVNITVGITPQLESLIGGMLRLQGLLGMEKAETEAPKKKRAAVAEAAETNDEKPVIKKQDPGKDVKVEEVQTIQQECKGPAEAKETAPAASEQKTTYTEEDIRQAMHECRVRFEGADYKDNPDSEGYAKYHKPLTAWFRLMAQTLGYDKPSILPVEMRHRFVEDCRGTIVGQDGNFVVSLPF